MSMKQRGVVLVLGTLLALGAVSPLTAADGPPPAKVVMARVSEQEVAQSRTTIGVLYYERVSDISTEVAGLVESISVKEGDEVKTGDVLVTLNTEILDQEIALTRTRIEQAELRIQFTGKNFKRLETLYKEAGVSEKDFDDALFDYQNAQKEKQASENSLKKLQIQKKRSIIHAPFDGIVLSKDVDSGAWVQQGRQLVRLGSSDEVYVRAPIAENILQYMEMGAKVPVTINAFASETTGEVVAIDPEADVKTKNVFVKIRIEPLPLMAQNMSATVHVPAGPKQMLRILPRAAVVKFQGKDFVYTVKDGKASILPVNIVTFLGIDVAVDSPHVVAGMEVVTEGNERLRPDQPVAVAGEN